ncbi:MAG: PQQ-like beta-propeller repeat protein, partial [Caldiserica bacterium]|nr:PQQ-like beta-propeller repeat protein [Caldisericota bacterium]
MFGYNAQHTGQCPYDTSENNGTLKWKFKTGSQIESSPAIALDGTVYIASTDNYLYALKPDGTLKWKYQVNSYLSSPAIGFDG